MSEKDCLCYKKKKITNFDIHSFPVYNSALEFESCDSKANGLFSSFTFKSFWDHPNSSKEILFEFHGQ